MGSCVDEQSTFTKLVRETYALGLSTEFGRSLITPGGFFEVVEEDVRGERMAVFKQRPRSVFDLLRNTTLANPDREYLVDESRRLTYRDHMTAVAALTGILRDEHGVQPGDRVALFAANSIEWVIGFWATVAAGAVVSAMNSYWSEPETLAALDLTEPKVVLGDAKRLATLRQVAPELPSLALDADLYHRITGAPAEDLQLPESTEDEAVLLLFTSGTTGAPKAVTHAHRALTGTQQCSAFNALLRIGAFPTELPPPPRMLVGPPFFHLSALFSMITYTGSGGLLVLRTGRFDVERTMQAIESERVTYWLSVGSAAPRVAAHPALHRYDLSSLQMVIVGGAPLTPAVKRTLYATFPPGDDGIRMGYTSSEAGSVLATIGGPEFVDHPESTGTIQDGVQVAIRDESGHDLPPGSEGNIWVRSAYTLLEYWNDPAATAETLGNAGWLSMGDIGRIENGRLYINSRARDLIFVSAENVYPSEVENRLEEHPAVIECAVAGIDDPLTGQAVKAFVVLGEQATVEEEALTAWCRGGLPAYKVPTSWELRTDPLPRNPAGKILRSKLVAEDVLTS